jgi:transcriptional regulator with XRE-family HTH domain
MDKKSLQEIARLIKEGRIQKNYTQQELATATGLSLRSVQRIENAEVLPRAYTLKTLTEHLNIGLKQQALLDKPGKKKLNVGQKMILSVSAGILLFLIAGAYIFQSPKFPETAFELFLYIAAFVGVYMVVLLAIWR